MLFHHIGQAVADIDAYLADYMLPLFAPEQVTEKIADPGLGVSVCFATMRGGVRIELVEPLGDNSPVDGIIGSPRGGLYHTCYEVEDLKQSLGLLRRKGFLPLGAPKPAVAFNGRPVVFLLTPQHDLLELLQSA